MRLFIKLFSVIAILISLASIAWADGPVGTLFDWQPFVVNRHNDLNNSLRRILPKNSFIYEDIWGELSGKEELLQSDLPTINNLPDEMTNKGVLSKIKVTFSTVNSFLLPGDEYYLRSKDGKLPGATKTLPSLLQNPSQDTVVETLRLIEPQVNFGFEF